MPIRLSIVTGNNGAGLMARLSVKKDLVPLSIHDTAESAIREVPALDCNFLLIDAELPCMDGFECVRWFKSRLPRLPVLMLARGPECNSELIFASVHAGASGCLPMSLSTTEWAAAIKEIRAGTRRGHRMVWMAFNSDRKFASAARHWQKMAGLIGANAAVVRYGPEWRRVVMTAKGGNAERPRQTVRRGAVALLPPDRFVRGNVAVFGSRAEVPPERAIVGRIQRI